jgi:hypothetical protein
MNGITDTRNEACRHRSEAFTYSRGLGEPLLPNVPLQSGRPTLHRFFLK